MLRIFWKDLDFVLLLNLVFYKMFRKHLNVGIVLNETNVWKLFLGG
jgi:hypothetical protein